MVLERNPFRVLASSDRELEVVETFEEEVDKAWGIVMCEDALCVGGGVRRSQSVSTSFSEGRRWNVWGKRVLIIHLQEVQDTTTAEVDHSARSKFQVPVLCSGVACCV